MPRRARAKMGGENVAGITGPRNLSHKLIAQLVHVRVYAAGQPAKAESREAALQKMLGGQPRHFPIVHADGADVAAAHDAPQVDRGNPGLQNRPGHLLVTDADQDSVRLRFAKPRRGRIVQTMRLEGDRPAAVFAVVQGHATDQTSTVGPRRIDQQQDVPQTVADGRGAAAGGIGSHGQCDVCIRVVTAGSTPGRPDRQNGDCSIRTGGKTAVRSNCWAACHFV